MGHVERGCQKDRAISVRRATREVPLLDMRKYHTLLAGASWMAEYGDPDDPEQWEWLQYYSPYHQVRSRASRRACFSWGKIFKKRSEIVSQSSIVSDIRLSCAGHAEVSALHDYPRVLVRTSTRDDRVHPGHARKLVHKLQAMGYAGGSGIAVQP